MVGNIVEAVESLYALGARDIIVVSLPDLGQLPFSGSAGGALSDLTKTHNKLLKKSLHQTVAHLKRLVLTEIDANAVVAALPEGTNTQLPALDAFFPPQIFPEGFRMSLCLVIDSATCADGPTFFLPPPGYLFWDSLHPTTAVHERLALAMAEALER